MSLKRIYGIPLGEFCLVNEEILNDVPVCINGEWFENGESAPLMYGTPRFKSISEIIQKYLDEEYFCYEAQYKYVWKITQTRKNGTAIFVDTRHEGWFDQNWNPIK